MNLLFFLILFPLLAAALMLLFNNDTIRGIIVRLSALVIAGAAIYLLITHFSGEASYYQFENPMFEKIMMGIEAALALFIFYLGFKHKKYLASLLVVIQAPLMLWFELTHHELVAEHNLFVDKFSIIMALIIGIIGSLICIYALGYMKDFHHHHHEFKDNRDMFFFIMFVFLSAMFGIVFANNLIWMYFFWEITTFCSFLLIGYTKTEEATNNSFRALIMNLLGGLGFALAIIFMGTQIGTIEMDKLLTLGGESIVLIPVMLLSFAGITKAAQMPFSSWLLGAMVAPTPTSALLHSSTMVKAGVYLIIRLAPLLAFNTVGLIVSLIGGITFLVGSLIAISQSNAKKVLAYSTVANLGLIVACGGVGTYEAVWAGILLIIFHAIAKSLLFLCVGTVEHNVGSRDIEDMDGLIMRMPKIAVMMVIGIAGMFLAPFGMLISKWAALRAFIDANVILVGLLAFGSAATLFFWTKWMGKLIAVVNKQDSIEGGVHKDEWFTLMTLSVLVIAICLGFPYISKVLIEPYVLHIFGDFVGLSQGNIIIMTIMIAMVLVLPLTLVYFGKKDKIVPVYLAGANTDDNMRFLGSMGQVKDLSMKNYYMENYFGEKKLALIGVLITSALLSLTFIIMLGGII